VDEESKNPGGRPPFEASDEMRKAVEAMSSVGIPQSDIAKAFGISEPTLRKYFREELDTAAIKANARVAANLYKQATKDDIRSATPAIFWLKTRMGWKDSVQVEHTGSIDTRINQMSDDELREFIKERAARFSTGLGGDRTPYGSDKPH
jgi:hypothetical protein